MVVIDYAQARKTVMANLNPEFMAALKVLFPLNRPLPGTPIDSIMHDSGQQSVVQYLGSLLEEASQNLLE